MAEHEVVIEWQGSDSHRNSIITIAESIEGSTHEEIDDGLKFIFRATRLNELRMMVDEFLEKCARIEQA